MTTGTKTAWLSLAAAIFAVACQNDDRLIEARVRESLARSNTPASQLEVEAHDRIVTVRGVVASDDERNRVEQSIRSARGVLAVDDRLVVQAPVRTTGADDIAFAPEDRAVKDAVRQRLDDARVGGVAVEVRGGVVTLRGHISPDRHEEAVGAAMGAPGVRRVDDALELR